MSMFKQKLDKVYEIEFSPYLFISDLNPIGAKDLQEDNEEKEDNNHLESSEIQE